MKRITIYLLSILLVLSLTACSGNSKNGNEGTNGNDVTPPDNGAVTTTPEASSSNDPEEQLILTLKSLLSLADELGSFTNAENISGVRFFCAVRHTVGHIKEEFYYYEYDVNKEFPHPIYTYDITKFDEYSLKLLDTTFEYAALEDESFSFYEYTYNGEDQLIIEKVTGFGGGPSDIEFFVVYDGYEKEDNVFTVSAHYRAESMMGEEWDTEITSEMTVELVDGVYKLRSYVINGNLSSVVPPTEE